MPFYATAPETISGGQSVHNDHLAGDGTICLSQVQKKEEVQSTSSGLNGFRSHIRNQPLGSHRKTFPSGVTNTSSIDTDRASINTMVLGSVGQPCVSANASSASAT